MKKLIYKNNQTFYNNLKKHLSKRSNILQKSIDKNVKKILDEVKNNGNKSLIKISKKFDNIELKEEELLIPNRIKNSYKNKIDKNIFKSFKKAIINVKKFHKLQIPKILK